MKEVYLVYRYDFPFKEGKFFHGCYATQELAQKAIDTFVRKEYPPERYPHFGDPSRWMCMEVLQVIEE